MAGWNRPRRSQRSAWPAGALTAIASALVAVFTNFVADERACCGAPDGAHRAPKHGIARRAAYDSADAGADLGAGGIGCAPAQGQGCGAGSCYNDVTDFHGRVPLKVEAGRAVWGGPVNPLSGGCPVAHVSAQGVCL